MLAQRGSRPGPLALLLLVFAAAAALRAYLLPSPANYDLSVIRTFAERLAAIGPRDYYLEPAQHYPPGYLYILWGLGELHQTFLPGISDRTYFMSLKMPANLFDFTTAFLIFLILKKRASEYLGILGASVYLFNPAIAYDSAVWGQFDAALAFFCLAAMYLLVEQNKPELAAISMSLAVLVKAQAIGLVPIFALALFLRTRPKRVASSLATALIVTFFIQLPFFQGDPFFGMISLTRESLDSYRWTSVNAFNLWWVLGPLRDDQATFLLLNKQQWGTALWVAAQAAIGFWLWRNRKDDASIYWAASLALFAFFVLPTRIHERYLFPFFSFFTIGVLNSRYRMPLLALYGCLSVLHFLNLYAVQQSHFRSFFEFALSHKSILAYFFVGSFTGLLIATVISSLPLDIGKRSGGTTTAVVPNGIRRQAN